jgi:hypothetical protein
LNPNPVWWLSIFFVDGCNVMRPELQSEKIINVFKIERWKNATLSQKVDMELPL